jgi:tetratricopeptide (TPR) repeat protein
MKSANKPSAFLRYTPPDVEGLRVQIDRERACLQAAIESGDAVRTLDHAGNLGAMLTSDRREAEAHAMLGVHLAAARRMEDAEEAAWLMHALATAAQYLGRDDEANACFAEALGRARAQGWRRLEHFILHHWGRCLAEQCRMDEARECFERSLAIRVELGDSLQESSRRALAELARLQHPSA